MSSIQLQKVQSLQHLKIDQNKQIDSQNPITDRQLNIANLDYEQSVIEKEQNQQDCTSNLAKHRINIFAIISLIINYVIYVNHQSFKELCPHFSQVACLNKFIYPKMKQWVIRTLIDSILGVLQFHFLISGSTFRFIPFLGIWVMAYLYYFSDQTISGQYYIGAFNLIHIIISPAFLSLYVILKLFLFCFKTNRKLFNWIIISTIIISLFLYNFILPQSCDYWQHGINGKIQKIDGVCNIKTPTICWYKIIDGKVGLSWVINNCYTDQTGKDTFNKQFQRQRKMGHFISFPNPTNFSDFELNDQIIQWTIFRHAQGFKTLQEAKQSPQKPDVVFDSQKQIYHIDVQRNQALVKRRAQMWEALKRTNSPPLAKNVLFLFMDTVGRQSIHLKLPKVTNWFKKQAVYQSYFQHEDPQLLQNRIQIENELKDEAYEFYRYNSLKALTQPNLLAMYYGYRTQEQDNFEQTDEQFLSVVKYFKDRGYITGSSNTLCAVNSIGTSITFNGTFDASHYDHQTHSYACDPNFRDTVGAYDFSNGHSSSGTRCLYNRSISQYAIQYAQSFFQKYKNQPKFYSMHFLQGHQFTGQVVKTLNGRVSAFIENLEKKGYLEDTVVMLVSDHGMHMLLLKLDLQNQLTEKNLPGMMIRLPKRMNKIYRNTIRKNQQYVVTSLNIHHFLKHIALGEQYEDKKQSLLSDLTDNTSCEKVGIYQPKYCSCK